MQVMPAATASSILKMDWWAARWSDITKQTPSSGYGLVFYVLSL